MCDGSLGLETEVCAFSRLWCRNCLLISLLLSEVMPSSVVYCKNICCFYSEPLVLCFFHGPLVKCNPGSLSMLAGNEQKYTTDTDEHLKSHKHIPTHKSNWFVFAIIVAPSVLVALILRA